MPLTAGGTGEAGRAAGAGETGTFCGDAASGCTSGCGRDRSSARARSAAPRAGSAAGPGAPPSAPRRGSSRLRRHPRLLGEVDAPEQCRPFVLERRHPLGEGRDILEVGRRGGDHRKGRVVLLGILHAGFQAGGLPVDECIQERPLLAELLLGVAGDSAHRTRATRLTPSRAVSAAVSASGAIEGSTSAWGSSNAMSAAKRRGRESGSARSTNAGAFACAAGCAAVSVGWSARTRVSSWVKPAASRRSL